LSSRLHTALEQCGACRRTGRTWAHTLGVRGLHIEATDNSKVGQPESRYAVRFGAVVFHAAGNCDITTTVVSRCAYHRSIVLSASSKHAFSAASRGHVKIGPSAPSPPNPPCWQSEQKS